MNSLNSYESWNNWQLEQLITRTERKRCLILCHRGENLKMMVGSIAATAISAERPPGKHIYLQYSYSL